MDGGVKKQVLDAYLAKRPELKRFLVARFRDESFAEDILQDIYLKLERADLQNPVDNLGAFLYRTANNLALDRKRQAQNQHARDQNWTDTHTHSVQDTVVQDEPDMEAALDARRRLKRAMALVAQLPPQCRRVFIAHKIDGLSYRDVADTMKISKKTVEKHMSKALKYLVLHLKDQD